MTTPASGTPASFATASFTTDTATISYDVHGDLTAGRPLMVIASPMGADGFAELVTELGDRPMITYDPRGWGRSPQHDPTQQITPEQHAGDLARIVAELGVDEVDVFASSGGAVNALAWVTAGAPIATLVAHEPPIIAMLPDRAEATAVTKRMNAAYDEGGIGPGMARFLALSMHEGVFTDAELNAPTPDPANFGLPTEDNGDRTDPLIWQNRPCWAWIPDLPVLRKARTRVLIGIGEESAGILTGRASLALAEQLSTEPTWFPGGHAGFATEHGEQGDPAGFAARLRAVLD